MKRNWPLLVSLLLCAVVSNAFAQAQYPAKPIRFILPFPPGGGTDTLGRMIAQKLGEALGQQVISDNRPGGGANLGAEIAAKSPPDGYTIFMGNVAHTINVSLYPKLNYDLVKDFAPVSILASTPNILVVHPSLPVKSVKDLIALAKARPGQLDFASAGSGSSSHLAGELFNSMGGVKLTHIPYKGGGPAVIALISGQVPVGFATTPSVMPHVTSGRVRGLAVTGDRRLPLAPDLPTISEAGIAGYEASTWYGLLVPTGTPGDIINRLHGTTVKILGLDDLKKRLESSGFQGIGSTPQEYAAYTSSEIAKWAKVIKAAGIRAD
ncbi:MAG: tripartite tricarboxylate transporter substrate binding protein [Burkholderiales bacterium]|nr:tripartite tricarboxylate transporter substrate binding protein [Burkholderiales bacterium]